MSEIDYMNDEYAPQGFEPRVLGVLAPYLVADCEVMEIQVQLREQMLPEADKTAAPFLAYVVFADPEARDDNRRNAEESLGERELQEVWGHYYVFDAGYTKVVALYDEFKVLVDTDPPASAELRATPVG